MNLIKLNICLILFFFILFNSEVLAKTENFKILKISSKVFLPLSEDTEIISGVKNDYFYQQIKLYKNNNLLIFKGSLPVDNYFYSGMSKDNFTLKNYPDIQGNKFQCDINKKLYCLSLIIWDKNETVSIMYNNLTFKDSIEMDKVINNIYIYPTLNSK